MNLKICNDVDSINPNFYWITDATAVVGFQPMRIKSEKNDNEKMRFFLFFYFLFPFFTKIYFRYGNLQKYTPSAQLPGGRDLAARQPGGRGFSAKK